MEEYYKLEEDGMYIGLTVVIAGRDFEITSVDDMKMLEVNYMDIQVKILDKQDIESLGFKGQESNTVYFKGDGYRLVHWLDKPQRITTIFKNLTGGDEEVVFKGIIKNKAELEVVLEQTGV